MTIQALTTLITYSSVYHIHVSPVSSNGNCSSTGSHLDPYNVGETVPCDPSQPDKCQVGDLSGKHGTMPGPNFAAKYPSYAVSVFPEPTLISS